MTKHSELKNGQSSLFEKARGGDRRALARLISYLENDRPETEDLIRALASDYQEVKVIGITGPPGVGKSTLVDGILRELAGRGKKTAVLCVDPSSPFHHGALLGDRLRMNSWHNHPDIFVRSMATRGVPGGLSPKIIEITNLVAACGFDFILIETVGVGQIEIDIFQLADLTVVVLAPESGDEIQAMKSGLMEIADIFVVNKADRPGADQFVKNLSDIPGPGPALTTRATRVIKTVATKKEGIDLLVETLLGALLRPELAERKSQQLADKAFFLIQQNRMRNIDKKELLENIKSKIAQGQFNLYQFVLSYGS
jgi:LAO/AO transport system kinase